MTIKWFMICDKELSILQFPAPYIILIYIYIYIYIYISISISISLSIYIYMAIFLVYTLSTFYRSSRPWPGGFAPNVQDNNEALDVLMEAIQKSGHAGAGHGGCPPRVFVCCGEKLWASAWKNLGFLSRSLDQ